MGKYKDFWREYEDKTDNVIGAGPFIDDTGGMIVLTGESIDETVRLAHLDPAVIGNNIKSNCTSMASAFEKNLEILFYIKNIGMSFEASKMGGFFPCCLEITQ